MTVEIRSLELKNIRIIASAQPQPGPVPVLINGDFSNGTTGWTSNAGFGTYSTTSSSIPAVYNGALWFSYTQRSVTQTVDANLSGRTSVTLTCNLQHTQNDNQGGESNGYTAIDTYNFSLQALSSSNTVIATARTPASGNANAPQYPTNVSVTLTSGNVGANWSNIARLRITLIAQDSGYWNGNWGPRFYSAELSVT